MIRAAPRYAELATTTNFSFLRGGSHPEELVAEAARLGLEGLGIADRNTLAGVVRAHVYARQNRAAIGRLRIVVGARLSFADATPDILAYPKDRAAYGRLCRLLSAGNLRAKKGECLLTADDLIGHGEGLLLIAMPGAGKASDQDAALKRLAAALPGQMRIAATMTYGAHMRGDLAARAALARRLGLPLIAANDVIMHAPGRRPLTDVVACIREGLRVEDAGLLLAANAERHLKDATEMARLFREAPEAVEETMRVLEAIHFSLDELVYEYPDELRQGHATPQAALDAFAWEGAHARYPDGVPDKVAAALRHELALVAELAYAPYFLTVHDIVRFARGRGILCQGRGSAANSAVCYCLGITEVDPSVNDLLFERFISPERREPPDIDVDFEHERREEVIQYIYQRYGRERSGLAAAVITYRGRSSIREVGKAFGLSDDLISALSLTSWGFRSRPVEESEARRAGFDPDDPTLKQAIRLASELSGFPRHLTQHSGGFVITQGRLDELCPILNAAMEDRTTIEWDKDDLDALGILKIDVLALGMLTCLRKGFDLIAQHYGERLALASIAKEEACVYAMIQRADTIGVFQIESRAQMSMLPRLKPATFYDLVIEVAIVRPGPIQGDMVHPYLRRRQGIEPVSYPSPELESVLGKTLGVPLFQEQAMKIAIVAAGFTPVEADQLRRAMKTFRRVGTIGTFQTKMVEGMTAKGYAREFAEHCFSQIEGFGEYGFPESHAASFALLVYASAWMKCRYPDAFCAALINAQPMGFYAPSQIVRDAREHGVEVRDVDINLSDWDCTLEPSSLRAGGEAIQRSAHGGPWIASPPARKDGQQALDEPGDRPRIHRRHASMAGDIRTRRAVRLGLRQIVGAREADMRLVMERRGAGYDSLRDLWLRTGLSPAVLERLADADAFRSLGLDRRTALWAARGLDRVGDQDDLPLFAATRPTHATEPDAKLPPMPLGAHVVEDYRHLSLSLKAHPVAFVRRRLDAKGILRCEALDALTQRKGPGVRVAAPSRVTVAGLVLVRQRPGTASGVVFMTIEDETGIANLIVWPKVFERLRPIVIGARFVAVTGKLQSEDGVIHVIAERMEDLTPTLGQLAEAGPGISGLARADEVRRPQLSMSEKRARAAPTGPNLFGHSPADPAEDTRLRRALPGGRNFQ